MERNEETLSTRDLAPSNEPARGVATAEGDARAGAVADRQRAVSDSDQLLRGVATPPVGRGCTARHR